MAKIDDKSNFPTNLDPYPNTAEKSLAACIFAQDQKRQRYFPAEILTYPFWEIIQYLYINDDNEEKPSQSEIEAGIRLDSPFADRYFASLEKRRIIESCGNGMFGKAKAYRLSTATKDKMTSWLEDCIKTFP